MKLLEDKILNCGTVLPGDVLKVDSFLNHQIDVDFINQLGKEFYRLFSNEGVNKILTIEASGIGIACLTAQYFSCPVVFAKKSKSKYIATDVYAREVESYTHKNSNNVIVSKKYLSKDDRVLIIDDFLATGKALIGLSEIVIESGATLIGAGIAIEKVYQGGGKFLRDKGIRIESLAMIESMTDDGKITFTN